MNEQQPKSDVERDRQELKKAQQDYRAAFMRIMTGDTSPEAEALLDSAAAEGRRAYHRIKQRNHHNIIDSITEIEPGSLLHTDAGDHE